MDQPQLPQRCDDSLALPARITAVNAEDDVCECGPDLLRALQLVPGWAAVSHEGVTVLRLRGSMTNHVFRVEV
jgi:hypothetical protein